MVRKQLYITEAQERALKQRAREEGRSEAEVARRALATHLRPAGEQRPGAPTEASRKQIIDELLKSMRHLTKGRSFSKAFRRHYREEGRAAIYGERLRRRGGKHGNEAPDAKNSDDRS